MSESAENRTPRDVRDNDQGHAATKRRSRRGIRFGLLELLLLTAAIAAWLPVAIAHRQIKQLDLEIQTMATLTTDLVIMDDQVLNIRTLPAIWMNIASWKYNAPPDADLELRFATEGINHIAFPVDYRATALPEGQHTIHLKQAEGSDGYHWEVYIDDELVLQQHHAPEWLASMSSSIRGDVSDQSTAFPITEPLKLRDQRYSINHPMVKNESIDSPKYYDEKGNFLWISPRSIVPESPPKFITSEQDSLLNTMGHRQGIRVRRTGQQEAAGLIDIQPSMSSVLGDQDYRNCCRLGVSVRPVLVDESEPERPEEQVDPGIPGRSGMPISYRETIKPPSQLGDRNTDTRVTAKSIREDGDEMRVFAHYPQYPSGAQPIVEILFDAAYPNRVGFLPHAAPDSTPMKACQFVTQYDARFFWREIELLPGSVADADITSEMLSSVPLLQLYPESDLAIIAESNVSGTKPFPWQNIPLARLPRIGPTDAIAERFKMSLITDVADSSKLTFPQGLNGCLQYEGVANRQVWWLPATAANKATEPEITVDVRATAVFPTTKIPLVGGPAIGNVRITVPMPATEPIWLEIVAEPRAKE